jgi:hypothetical protein
MNKSGLLLAFTILSLTTLKAHATIIFSEIHYNPALNESRWEWIEVFNSSNELVDLNGWVLDDNNSQAHSGSNIAGSIAANSFAVLYNADALSSDDFHAEWGFGAGGLIPLIEVSGWSRLSLGNTGDKISLWDSFASYKNDHQNHASTVTSLMYESRSPWPSADGFASIYLQALDLLPSEGSHWRLSTPGTDQAYVSNGVTIAGIRDIGSPGIGPVPLKANPVPEASGLSLLAIAGLFFLCLKKSYQKTWNVIQGKA